MGFSLEIQSEILMGSSWEILMGDSHGILMGFSRRFSRRFSWRFSHAPSVAGAPHELPPLGVRRAARLQAPRTMLQRGFVTGSVQELQGVPRRPTGISTGYTETLSRLSPASS